ncbi:hypothetical protein KA005_41765 [bacterium]|nr:hypothetical protein [bacterium]
MKIIAGLITEVLQNPESESVLKQVRGTVWDLYQSFPIYQHLGGEA